MLNQLCSIVNIKNMSARLCERASTGAGSVMPLLSLTLVTQLHNFWPRTAFYDFAPAQQSQDLLPCHNLSWYSHQKVPISMALTHPIHLPCSIVIILCSAKEDTQETCRTVISRLARQNKRSSTGMETHPVFFSQSKLSGITSVYM